MKNNLNGLKFKVKALKALTITLIVVVLYSLAYEQLGEYPEVSNLLDGVATFLAYIGMFFLILIVMELAEEEIKLRDTIWDIVEKRESGKVLAGLADEDLEVLHSPIRNPQSEIDYWLISRTNKASNEKEYLWHYTENSMAWTLNGNNAFRFFDFGKAQSVYHEAKSYSPGLDFIIEGVERHNGPSDAPQSEIHNPLSFPKGTEIK